MKASQRLFFTSLGGIREPAVFASALHFDRSSGDLNGRSRADSPSSFFKCPLQRSLLSCSRYKGRLRSGRAFRLIYLGRLPVDAIRRTIWTCLKRRAYQFAAIIVCVLMGTAMIVNNEMGGEAMWFWYATTFHHGARLYRDLHVALQPLFVLFTEGWMAAFGNRLLVTQMPPLLEIGVMCAGLLLLLRESDWPDWQKGIFLLGTFCFIVCGHSYRFDDYHVLAENLIIYALLLLLRLAKTSARRKLAVLVASLGLLTGLTITTRLTDGMALLGSATICLLFLLRQHRLKCVALFLAIAAITVIVVVKLTGDTMSAYLSNTVFLAAASKGGTGSIFTAPFRVLANTGPLMYRVGKRPLAGMIVIFGAGPLIARYWKPDARYVFRTQVAVAALLLLIAGTEQRLLLQGVVISTVVLTLIPLPYLLTVFVLARCAVPSWRDSRFDQREILVILVLAEWASYSAGAAAEPLTNYYAPLALLLLLVPILQPSFQLPAWVSASFVTLMALLTASTLSEKFITPYSWQNYVTAPMFHKRVFYKHPVFGPMYIDRELLKFSAMVCSDIGATSGAIHPELLSLPYPFPNYFCDTPPWHDYVQTFFDTSRRSTIEELIHELNVAPPEWIVYQRQMNILRGAETLYNHGQPLAQRDLDTLIEQKLGKGEWTLVDKSEYLGNDEGNGWFIIRTR